jgi:hypothetical protein
LADVARRPRALRNPCLRFWRATPRLSRKGIRHLAKLDLGRDRRGNRGARAWACCAGRERRATTSPSSGATARALTGRWSRRRWSARCRCRSTRTRSPKRWPMCWSIAARASSSRRPGTGRQGDRGAGARAPVRAHHLSDPRGLRKYDHTRLHALSHVQAEGRAAHERFEKELAAREAELTYDAPA